jgi:hypothetical protein
MENLTLLCFHLQEWELKDIDDEDEVELVEVTVFDRLLVSECCPSQMQPHH